MQAENKRKRTDAEKKLTALLTILFIIILCLLVFLMYLLVLKNEWILRSITVTGLIIVFVSGMLLLSAIVVQLFIGFKKEIPGSLKKSARISIVLLYPIVLFFGKIFRFNTDTIQRAYANLNNILVLDREYNLKGDNILVLIPHCIQKSTCIYKVTDNTDTCKRCGECKIDRLIEFKNKYGIHLSVVTGGTLARKKIKEVKPEMIIAVACERDLINGLMDVRAIPVVGIINERPEGPCVNTQVDLQEVEKIIQYLIKE